MTLPDADRCVYVIDDDVDFAESVRYLLSSVNFPVRLYHDADTFLAALDPKAVGCVLVDVRMPGMGGLQLQQVLRDKAPDLPVLIMTAHGDIGMAVHAMKDGAMDFIQKPFNDQKLIDLINAALNLNAEAVAKRQKTNLLRARLDGLTRREREVLELVVDGNTNKEVASKLGISDKTVEVHRAKIMEKTETRSVQELMKLVLSAGLGG